MYGFGPDDVCVVAAFGTVVVFAPVAGDHVFQDFFHAVPGLQGGDADPLNIVFLLQVEIDVGYPSHQDHLAVLHGDAGGDGAQDMLEGIFLDVFEEIGGKP